MKQHLRYDRTCTYDIRSTAIAVNRRGQWRYERTLVTTNELSARLEQVREEKGFSTLKDFWRQLIEGDQYEVSYEAVRNYHFNRQPPVAYLARVADVFGYRLEWLIKGEEPRTVEEQKRELEAKVIDLARDLSEEPLAEYVEEYLEKLRGGQELQYRNAVLRFSKTLEDAATPQFSWFLPEGRKELLAEAMRFLVGVDSFFRRGGRWDDDEEPQVTSDKLQARLVRSSKPVGFAAYWTDAVLQLFATRVEGLGVRTGGLMDSHAPWELLGLPEPEDDLDSSSPGQTEVASSKETS